MHYGIIGLAAGLVALVWAVAAYNRLTALNYRVRGAYAQIDTQLKRRYDLIPNLVETVKGYMAHERETFEAVTKARTQAMAAGAAVRGDAQQVGFAAALRGLLSAGR